MLSQGLFEPGKGIELWAHVGDGASLMIRFVGSIAHLPCIAPEPAGCKSLKLTSKQSAGTVREGECSAKFTLAIFNMFCSTATVLQLVLVA